MELDRRNLLRLTGATAALSTAGLAGCLDSVGLDDGDDPVDGDAGDPPAYARWGAWNEDTEETIYAYVDWAALEQFDDVEADQLEEEEETDDDIFEHEDPLLAIPAASVMVAALWGGFSLMGTGLGGLLSTDDEEDEENMLGDDREFDSAVDSVLLVDETFVLEGSIEVDEIHDVLTEEPETEFGLKTVYEQTTEIGAFDVYEPATDDDEDDGMGGMTSGREDAIAVSDEAIVVADVGEETDAVDLLHAPIEARDGDRTRATEEHDRFEWALAAAGHGHVAFGAYGDLDDEDDADEEIDPDEESELDEIGDADGMVASLTIEDETEWHGAFAATFDDLADDAEATLEAELGTSAHEASYDVGDDRVFVSATWDEDVTEIDE